MKNSEVIILGGAALFAWMLVSRRPGATVAPTRTPASGAAVSGADNYVNEVFAASGTPFENGWRYYENGTSIDPQGNYYFQGQMVYSSGSGAGGASAAW